MELYKEKVFDNGFKVVAYTNNNNKMNNEILDRVLKVISEQTIYVNNRTGQNWCYDTQLERNIWIDNIFFNNSHSAVTFCVTFV